MYEMYPASWSAEEIDRHVGSTTAKDVSREGAKPRPHRRARKEHSVAPRVLRTLAS